MLGFSKIILPEKFDNLHILYYYLSFFVDGQPRTFPDIVQTSITCISLH